VSGADPGAGGLPPLGLGDIRFDQSGTDPLDGSGQETLAGLPPGTADWVTALLKGWVTVVDVIAFYAERILNASYLPTVEQPAALNELYRSLGHAFPANTAATTMLSYQVSDRGAGVEAVARARRGGAGGPAARAPAPPPAPPPPSQLAAASSTVVFGVPRQNLAAAAPAGQAGTGPAPPAVASPGARTTIPAGSQVRAVPDQGAPPPVFVTLADLDARPGLSGLRPRLAASAGPPPLTGATTQLELDGTSTGLKAGTPVLIVADSQAGDGSGQPASWVRTLTAVTPDAQRKSTRITWSEPLSAPAAGQAPADLGSGTVYAFASCAQLVGSDAQPWPPASAATRAAAFAGVPQPARGGVLRSADGGTSWSPMAALPPAVTQLTAVAAVGDVLLVGAGDDGVLISVAGSPLTAARLPGGNHGVTCAGGSPARLLVGTGDGLVLQSADDGRSWSRVSGGPPTKHDLQVIAHQLPGSPVHAVLDTGQRDMLLAGTDTGLYLRHAPGWDPEPGAPEAIFALLQVTPRMFAAGGAAGVKVLTGSDAEHLTVTARLAGTRVYALAMTSTPAGPVVYAGTEDGVRRAADAALAAWQPVNGQGAGALPAGVPVTALAAAPGLLLAATPAGLYRSRDDGQQWQRCTTAELFTVPAGPGTVTAAAAPPSWLLAAFSARGIEFGAGVCLTAVAGGLELTDEGGVTYLLTGDSTGWSVALADGLPAVTAVTTVPAGAGVAACVSPVAQLAGEWPGFLVAGRQLELSGTVRTAVPGGRGAIVQQTAAPQSQALDITAVELDAGQRFGQAARLTRVTVKQELPAGAFPRRTSTVWAGAAALPLYQPPPASVTPVSGTRIPLSAPLDMPLPAGRLGSVTGQPLQVAVAPLGGVLQVTPAGVTARGPAQADALDLCVTADADVVIGTAEGVFILAPQAAGPVLADRGWPGGAATAVASPAPGVVLAATPHGVLGLTAGPGNRADAGWADGGLPGLEIVALSAGSGRVVASTRGGAVYQATEPAAGRPAWSALPAPPAAASVLLIAGDRAYAATASDVLVLAPGGTWQPAGRGAPPGVTSLAVGSDSTVWAGSPLGVASLPPQAGQWREDPNAILGGGVTALAMTPDGRLTAATPQGIWARSAAGAWEAVADPGAVSLNALAYAADGTLWAAASDAALILPQAAAAPSAVRPAALFAGLPVQADDLATLDQGGLPAAVADAIQASTANTAGGNETDTTGTGAGGPALDRSALTVTPAATAGDAWRLTAGADVYLVVRRDTPRGSRLSGYACQAVAAAAGAPAAGPAGIQVLPVSFAAGPGTTRARQETIIWLPAAADAAPAAETVTLAAPDPGDPAGILSLQAPLGNIYDGATVQVNLNIVAAAEGRPAAVTLGTGDPGQASQSFPLPTPVAMVASGAATGDASGDPQSSLAVTVGDVPWTQASTLLAAGKDDRVYTFDAGHDGSGTIRFGDGVHGARLPAGPVVATYLQGGGATGVVAEGTLIQPLDRPQLVQAVHNPQPAQLPPQAPAGAPLAQVRFLGRIVTLQDFRDAAQVCPGVACAQVQLLGGEPREIVVTLAAAPGADPGMLAAGVAQTLRSQATGDLPLRVLPAIAVPVLLHVRIVAGQPGAEAALRDCLGGLTARRPGDPLLASQVLAAASGVDGVAAAMIVGWGREGAAQTRRTALPARSARRAGDQRVLTAAELLYIDGRSDRLTITVGGRTATDDGA
jgi:hypothetical protein